MTGMLELLDNMGSTFASTVLDVLPIAVILLVFQLFVLRRVPPHPSRIIIGFIYVLIGLTLFLVGLEIALFPLGKTMAAQLTAPEFIAAGLEDVNLADWRLYGWVYLFAAAIGFATTIAEPSLIAVSIKAQEISGGSIASFGLRIAVAIGVAAGVALGAFRIVTGTPLPWYIIAGYIIVILQTLKADKRIIPLAFDSGGVTTSTVTVPVVAALGLGLASAVPGRSVLIDGFGLIAFASLFPIMSVMAYANLTAWIAERQKKKARDAADIDQTEEEEVGAKS